MGYRPKVGDLVQFKRSYYNLSLTEKQSLPGPANMSDMEYWYGPHTDKWIGVVIRAGIKMSSWDIPDDMAEGIKICWNDSTGASIISEYLTSYITEIELIPEENIYKEVEKAEGI